jgi:uncharacterized protein (DUF2249 family)
MDTVIDFRNFEARTQQALFFSLFEGLKEGTSFEFINDQDPTTLYQQLKAMDLGNLDWSSFEAAPGLWKIRISKSASSVAAQEDESCCGVCGGHGHRQ